MFGRILCKLGFHNYKYREIHCQENPKDFIGFKAVIISYCPRCGDRSITDREKETTVVVSSKYLD